MLSFLGAFFPPVFLDVFLLVDSFFPGRLFPALLVFFLYTPVGLSLPVRHVDVLFVEVFSLHVNLTLFPPLN